MVQVRKLAEIPSGTELGDERYPVRLTKWDDGSLTLPADFTHFGFSLDGALSLDTVDAQTHLRTGGFFRINGRASITGRSGFVLSVPGSKGFTQFSGPYSAVPKIEYLAGGLQNCLIWPADIAGPALNTLHMRPRENQTPHTHTSLRINIIIDGFGACVTPSGDLPFAPLDLVAISANEIHSFRTNGGLRFISFHPDSDDHVFGARQNPMMLNTHGLSPESGL